MCKNRVNSAEKAAYFSASAGDCIIFSADAWGRALAMAVNQEEYKQATWPRLGWLPTEKMQSEGEDLEIENHRCRWVVQCKRLCITVEIGNDLFNYIESFDGHYPRTKVEEIVSEFLLFMIS